MAFSETNVLVADDDLGFTLLVRAILEQEGCAVAVAESSQEALRALTTPSGSFSLVLLDLDLPGFGGLATCQRIRGFSDIPMIVVTGRRSESDVVRSLESGADDYVVKPVSTSELVARIHAVLRRAGPGNCIDGYDDTYRSGGLTINFRRFEVKVDGRVIQLSPTEYRLLSSLARNAGRVLTPDQILQLVWGDEYLGETHLLRVTIGRLRQRLDDNPTNPQFILTKQRFGYLMPTPDLRPEVVFQHGSNRRRSVGIDEANGLVKLAKSPSSHRRGQERVERPFPIAS